MGEEQLTLETADTGRPLEVTVISHSTIIYWWPIWLIGFIMAALTYMQGEVYTFQEKSVLMHPSKNPGVIFTMVFILVFLMTNVSVRGLASALVIASIIIVTLFLAYMGWWDDFFAMVGNLAIYMNLGFYVFFSTAVFIIWALTVFIFDKMTYYTFRPGQMVINHIWGGAEKTVDTQGMSVYKKRDDLFRHWVLGMGSGDMHVAASGAAGGGYDLPSVMFIEPKLEAIQRLVAMRPDDAADMNTIAVGGPE